MDRKAKQLGMHPSTASGRLLKDILFSFIAKQDIKCFRCKKEMKRENFSIEHKVPWLDSEDPVRVFFDLENITFSHLKCNVANKRTWNRLNLSKEEMKARIARLGAISKKKHYTTERRRAQFKRTGT